jgi:Flp pilus assembly protein TadD
MHLRQQPMRKSSGLAGLPVLYVVLLGTSVAATSPDSPNCAAALAKGRELLGQRQFQEAQMVLLAASRTCPSTPAIFDTLGLAYDFSNQFDKAQAAYKKAVALDPRNAGFRNHLAASLMRSGDASDSEAEFGRVLKIDPNNTLANLNLGSLLLKKKQFEQAIHCFQAARVEQSQDAVSLLELAEAYFGAEKTTAARRAALRIAEVAGADSRIHFTLGLLLAEHGEYAMAVGQFEAIPPGERDAAADLNLGMAYSRLGRFEQARQAYQNALRLDPTSPEPYLRLGLDAAAQAKHAAALDWLAEAHNKAPGRADIACALAKELIHAGNFERAQEVLSSARERHPQDPSVWETFGDLYLRQHRESEAQQAYHECLRLNPRSLSARLSLARINLELGQSAEARNELEQVLRHDPHDADANALLGRMALQTGQADAALPYTTRALTSDTANLTANEDFAQIMLQQGKPAEALPALQRLVKADPDNPRFHYLLGQVLGKLHRSQEAQNEFRLSERLQSAQK